jgi:hypothetical protein
MSGSRSLRVAPLLWLLLVAGIIIGLVGGVLAVRLTFQPNWYAVASEFQLLIAATILFLGIAIISTIRFQKFRNDATQTDERLAQQRQAREKIEIAKATAILARLTLIAGDLVIPARLVLKTEANGGALLHQWRHGLSRRFSNALRRADTAVPAMWADLSRAHLGEIEQITVKLNQLERIVIEAQDVQELMSQADPDYFRTNDLYTLDSICLRILQMQQRIDGIPLTDDIPVARPNNLERFQDMVR